MRIKITNCYDSMLWYYKHQQEEFEVQRTSLGLFWVREPDEYHCLNFVYQQDATVLDSAVLDSDTIKPTQHKGTNEPSN